MASRLAAGLPQTFCQEIDLQPTRPMTPQKLLSTILLLLIIFPHVRAEKFMYGTGEPDSFSFERMTPEYLLSLSNGYDTDALKQLSSKANRSNDENRALMELILMAAAKSDARFSHLLMNKDLRKSRNVELALAAYDYALNKSEDSLNTILAQIACDPMGGDVDSIVVLGVVNEWPRSISAYKKHFHQTDGAGGSCMRYFLKMRSKLYPEKYKNAQKMFSNTKFKNVYEAYLEKEAEQAVRE